jgi:hypothetical protein
MTAEYLLTNNGTDNEKGNITIPSFSELIGIPINLNDFLKDYDNYNGKFNSSLNHIDEEIVDKILSKQTQNSKTTTTTTTITTPTEQQTSIIMATSLPTLEFTEITSNSSDMTANETIEESTTTTTTTMKTTSILIKKPTTTKKINKPDKTLKNFTAIINCQELNDGDLVPDPGDCTSFYTCFKGKIIAKRKCNHNLYFDTNLKVCNWPDEVRLFKILIDSKIQSKNFNNFF